MSKNARRKLLLIPHCKCAGRIHQQVVRLRHCHPHGRPDTFSSVCCTTFICCPSLKLAAPSSTEVGLEGNTTWIAASTQSGNTSNMVGYYTEDGNALNSCSVSNVDNMAKKMMGTLSDQKLKQREPSESSCGTPPKSSSPVGLTITPIANNTSILMTPVSGSATTAPFQCSICHKLYNKKSAFRAHQRSHNISSPAENTIAANTRVASPHTNNAFIKTSTILDDPYRCNICSKTFAVPARLTRHYRTHTGEKPFHCEFCNKCFSVKENLSVHRRIHTKERPYKCEVCSRAFEHSGKLHRHMRIHTGERPHKCSICSKTFIQSGQLVIHLRTHTGEKPYVCQVCQKGFTCSKQLKVHSRTHTGEKPYSCDICGKSFGYNHVLKLHQVAHYGEKVYKCTICNDTFTSKKSMEAHIKSHSDQQSHVSTSGVTTNPCNTSQILTTVPATSLSVIPVASASAAETTIIGSGAGFAQTTFVPSSPAASLISSMSGSTTPITAIYTSNSTQMNGVNSINTHTVDGHATTTQFITDKDNRITHLLYSRESVPQNGVELLAQAAEHEQKYRLLNELSAASQIVHYQPSDSSSSSPLQEERSDLLLASGAADSYVVGEVEIENTALDGYDEEIVEDEYEEDEFEEELNEEETFEDDTDDGDMIDEGKHVEFVYIKPDYRVQNTTQYQQGTSQSSHIPTNKRDHARTLENEVDIKSRLPQPNDNNPIREDCKNNNLISDDGTDESMLTPPNSNPVSPVSSPDPELSLPPRKRSKMILKSMQNDDLAAAAAVVPPVVPQRYSSVIHYARAS